MSEVESVSCLKYSEKTIETDNVESLKKKSKNSLVCSDGRRNRFLKVIKRT